MIFRLFCIACISGHLISCDTAQSEPQEETARKESKHGTNAYAHTKAILEFGPRPVESEGLQKVRTYVSTELKKHNWHARYQTFKAVTPLGEKTFTNILARHGEQDDAALWEKPVKGVLCAHIDSKPIPGINFLGADDAASACAAIIEIARTLHTESPRKAGQLELVFFDGEEALTANMGPVPGSNLFDGIYGSRTYATQWRSRGKLPAFGLLLDMVGHKDLSIRLPSDSPKDLKKSLLAAAQATGSGKYFGMASGPILDDHIPLNNVGIPTIDMIGDFTRKMWWHEKEDNLSIISAESLETSIRVALFFLKERL